MIFFFRKKEEANPHLLSERIEMRLYQKKDAASVGEVLRRREIYAATGYIEKDFPQEKVGCWLEAVSQSYLYGRGIELGMFSRESGQYLGNMGIINLNPQNHSGEISYFVHPQYWHRGYATEGAERILHYGFEKLGIYRMEGNCMVQNIASARVMERLGFQREGIARCALYKEERYIDIARFSLLKPEWESRELRKKNYK